MGRGIGRIIVCFGAVGLFASGQVLAASGGLLSLQIPGMVPAYAPGVTSYTIPDDGTCSIPVTATLNDLSLSLYVQSNPTVSGATANAWVCGSHSTLSVVVYRNWSEVERLSITKGDTASLPVTPPPEPTPPDEPEETAAGSGGALASLVVAGLSPAFSGATHHYTMPDPPSCSVQVKATLANPQHQLQVQGNPTTSGSTVSAWVCDGHPKLSIVVYSNWTEVGRYTVYKASEGLPPDLPVDDGGGTPSPGGSEPTIGDGGADSGSGGGDAGGSPGSDYEPSPTGYAEAARMLSYASFGPDPESLNDFVDLGADAWLDAQFAMPASLIPNTGDMNGLRAQVFANMATGEGQLRQRVIFALGQILVVSANKNVNAYEMAPWVQLLSDNAFGNYRTLLRQVSISPSMGKYLDHANSRKASATTAPNENYPRELMQLFSIGLWQLKQDGSQELDGTDQPIPTYTQNELREVARALTGWTYPTAPGAQPGNTNWEYFVGDMEPRVANHDAGAKTLPGGYVIPAGQTPDQDLDSVLDFLFHHQNVAPFVATRLIRLLVTSNPSPEYIARVADAFDDNGTGVRGDLKAVIRAVLTDVEATDAEVAGRARLKDPIVYFIGLARALSATFNDPSGYQYVFANLSEHLLTPPSVFSFYSLMATLPGDAQQFGPEFQIYPPSLAIQRANLVYQLLTNQFGSALQVDLSPYLALGGNVSDLLDKINADLLQGRMSTELRTIIETATNAAYDDTQRVIGALYLTAVSGEYQVQQ
ncbi:MAG: DUF1800 domain-containing protein [Chromatiales bacterium]|nr:DUF1800 domain-containing protein [Chromatiales bacterium]